IPSPSPPQGRREPECFVEASRRMSVRSKPNREGKAPAEPEHDVSELPEGWAVVKLQEIGSWRSGGTPSRTKPEYFGQGIPWVKSGDLPDGPITKTDEEITQLGLDNSAAKLMPPGTVCMALYGATIGKLGTMTFEAATNQATANLVPDESLVDGQYVFNYLMSERQSFIDLGQGGAQPNISQEIVRNHPIKLPPLAEQRRIVLKLELLLGKVSSSQQRLSRVPGLLKRFRQSVLAAACSGKLTADWREENPQDIEQAETDICRIDAERRKELALARQLAKHLGAAAPKKPCWEGYDAIPILENSETPASWITIPVGFLCDCIVPGRDKPKSFTGKIPWVTLPDIIGPEISASVSGLGLSASEIEEVNARIIPINAVVMSCIGRFGLAAVVTTPLVVNQQLHAFIPSPTVLPKYLAFHIPVLADHMNLIATSTTIAYINKDNCNSIPINLPPLSEQQEIVRRVEKLFSFADQIEARLRQAQSHVDRLTQSILAKAFRGELVPTEAELARHENRSYDPASELLARIQAEREQSGEPSKVTTKRAKAATRK
ncbi:MAG: restriction endonuclease subunit S, partial [Planctomycetota bacterium]